MEIATAEAEKAMNESRIQQIQLKLGDGAGPLEAAVTVVMPRSLPELQHVAAQQFGHHGCLRLFFKGTSLLYHPSQMKMLKDGDVVVVRRSMHRVDGGTGKDISTHQR